jgi:hypothetical protein
MKTKYRDLLYGLFLFGGILACMFAIRFFRLTFIPLEWSLLLSVLSGLLVFAFFRNKIGLPPVSLKDNLTRFCLRLVLCLLFFGGLNSLGFLAANFYLGPGLQRSEDFLILDRGKMINRGGFISSTFILIMKDGMKKQIIFDGNLPVEKYGTVRLTIGEGAFKLDVIRGKELR